MEAYEQAGGPQGRPPVMTPLDRDTIERLAAPVPRYTSYPTAPHFHAGVTSETYRRWLSALPDEASLSLYLHIPFCDTLCWFCGCATKIVRRYEPIAAYLKTLRAEMTEVGAALPGSSRVTAVHWGGGSPSILSAGDIVRLMDWTRERFVFASEAEFAIEIDPRGLDIERIDALAASGVTRVSIGVQDFDPSVQAAINRMQSVDETRAAIDAFRDRGVRSLNIDAIYGLPGQGLRELLYSLKEVVRMRPDRIALFGYAHVPWMRTHQKMIPEDKLPNVVERHAMAETAAAFLVGEGYERVGIDHFARPDDAMAAATRAGALSRNFQGYTVDDPHALIGLGASSISRTPHGYAQNAPSAGEYARRVEAEGLAVTRGLELGDDDVIRAHVIERLMCDLRFDGRSLYNRFGLSAMPLIAEARAICAEDRDGLLQATDTGFVVTAKGRPFARTVAAKFDAFLNGARGRHSQAV